MNVMGVMYTYTLAFQQKKDALCVINLVKDERCGKIKGCACADGRLQWKYIPRE